MRAMRPKSRGVLGVPKRSRTLTLTLIAILVVTITLLLLFRSLAKPVSCVTGLRVTRRKYLTTGTARIACGAGSVKRHGVRPSVCPSMGRQQQAQVCCSERAARTGDIDRLLQQRRAAGGRMRAVPRCQRT